MVYSCMQNLVLWRLQQQQFAKESSLLAKEKLCLGLSMFEMVLNKLRTFLSQDKEVWDRDEPAPAHSVMEVTSCTSSRSTRKV